MSPIVDAPPTTRQSAADSIEAILQIEKEDRQELALLHRVFHAIGAFFGTIHFIVSQCVLIAVWIALHEVYPRHAWAVDPFPYPLLATFLSIEAVLLTSCVLIRQNAMDRTAERRDHIELQINLLAEKEATRALHLLGRIADHLQVPDTRDLEHDELAKETPVEVIARDAKAREGREH